jgi:uncharacterized protein (DUF1501 family)
MAHDHCHCRDYTRSQLLHSAAAQAGKGLPTIETGMPTPAGTGLSRRTFLFRSIGLALSVYGATKLPFEALQEGIANAAAPTNKVLVSLFFDGGIDSLNVLAPIDNPKYHDLRPTLALNSGTLLEPNSDPNTRLYWHPATAKLRALHGEDKVSVLPAIGYDSPDQSHFTSRHFYEIGQTSVGANTGWLGRYIDAYGSPDNPLQGVSLDYALSPMLATANNPVAAVASVTDYNLPNWVWGGEIQDNMYASFANLGAFGSDSAAMTQARRATRQTAQVREELSGFDSLGTAPSVEALYPDTDLSHQLKSLAALIANPALSVQCVTLSATGGYDTHEDEAATLNSNLRATCDAVFAFQRDLEQRSLDDRVLINMWSEFGRRPEENGGGTDHGAAGVGFVVGKHAGGTTVGAFPGLATLDAQDNLIHTTDFRSVYTTLLANWLGVDPGPIIPGTHPVYADLLD